jgi:3-oxoacyl-[acyl-carrier-protein] synthase II
MSAIVVTGIGAVSSLGEGCAALWQGLAEGRDGIRPIARFSTDGLTVHLGALVPGHDQPRPDQELCLDFARRAASEAWQESRAGTAGIEPCRLALVLGTSIGRIDSSLHRFGEAIADELSIAGPRITVSTACTSSTIALGLASDLLRAGVADLVLAGGTDELTPKIFAGFHSLGVLSREKCAPFSSPPGTTLGEGAGFLVLESEECARRRGAEPRAAISGHGLAADAYHETSPDPSGAGVARAIRAALSDAGLRPEQIGSYNAHGTGTAANDPAEWRALQLVFGDHARRLPVSAIKSVIGHAQGAAGVLETIATILALERQLLLPTLRFGAPRRDGPVDLVSEGRPRPAAYDHAVSGNSAFGGSNAALVLSRTEAAPRRSRPPPRAIRVHGIGVVGAHGLELRALESALAAGSPLGGRVPPFAIEEVVRLTDPRGMDPSSRFLTAAAALALADAGVRVSGERRDRTGLVAGVNALSAESARAFDESIEPGLARLSAPAFARMVLNAPAGTASSCLSLRGPLGTVTIGEGSAALAVIQAILLLGSRPELDGILAGGLDELPGTGAAPDAGEGAACLLLSALPEAGSSPRIAGWGLAGPGHLETALGAALERAGLPLDAIGACFGSEDPRTILAGRWAHGLTWSDPSTVLGRAGAAGSGFACAAAALAVRRGDCRVALVTSAGGRSATAALILLAEADDGR